MGCFLIIITKKKRNICWAVGFHTAWNFTREFIFRLPNSGMSSGLAVFNATNSASFFFFNEAYGNEGSLLCTVILLIVIVIALMMTKKEKAVSQ